MKNLKRGGKKTIIAEYEQASGNKDKLEQRQCK